MKAFICLDSTFDGLLTKQDLEFGFRLINMPLEDEEIDKIFKEID